MRPYIKTGPKLAAALLLACAACATPEQARLRTTSSHPAIAAGVFETLRTQPATSDPLVTWYPVGPGMSGYNEELWTHPSDPRTILIGPDMHVSYGSWDGAGTWQSLKDPDGLGEEMKRVLDVEFSRQDPDFALAVDWNGWLYRSGDRGRSWTKVAELSRSWKEIGIDPYDPEAFAKGWYDEQLGTRLSDLAVDPTDDRIWYVGAGNFWDVKANHRSRQRPHGGSYAYADYGYILKSMDRGKSWRKITAGLPADLDVGRIIVNPNQPSRLIMATSHGLMLSENGGLSWNGDIEGLPNNLPRDLAIFHDPGTRRTRLYVVDQTAYEPDGRTVASRGGVFASDDFGRSWRSITGNLAFDLARLDYPLEVQRYYRTIGHWLGMSPADARKTYPQLPRSILPVFNRIAVSPRDPDEIYVTYNKKHDRTFGPGEVWRTLDGGRSWQVVARHGSYWEAGKDIDYWRGRGNPIGANVDFAHLQYHLDHEPEISGNRLLEIDAEGALYISIDQQTHRSTDKGRSWQQIDDIALSGPSERWVGRGNSDLPGRLMLLETGIPGRRLLASGEHGIWQTIPSPRAFDPKRVVVEQIEGQVHHDGMMSISSMAVHPRDPDILFALSWRQNHKGMLRRSTDGGRSWENIATVLAEAEDPDAPVHVDLGKGPPGMLPMQNALTIDPAEPRNMYVVVTRDSFTEIYRAARRTPAVGGYGFVRSRDGGYSWQTSNAGLHEGASLNGLALDPADPATLYAAANDANGGLYRSTDRGSRWERLTLPRAVRNVNSVFIDPSTRAIYITAGRPYDGTMAAGGAWRSRDGGASWQKIFEAPLVTQVESSPLDPDLLLLTVYRELRPDNVFANPGLYLSLDGGKTWKKINRGLNSHEKIVDAKPDPHDRRLLWAAGWGSGWNVGVIGD